jgi:hypothetical protein
VAYVVLILIVIFFVAFGFIFLFVLFLVGLLAKKKVVGCRAISGF